MNPSGSAALAAIGALAALVAVRSRRLTKLGVRAVRLGMEDKRDFLIMPLVLLYLYLIVAYTFGLPKIGEVMSEDAAPGYIGAALCALAPVLFLWGMASFADSFRVGLDEESPGALVTGGAFSRTRNPLYLAFFMILTGVFLIFPSWVFFAYLAGGLWLIDRQVCLEENSLRRVYKESYDRYCEKVRRYL